MDVTLCYTCVTETLDSTPREQEEYDQAACRFADAIMKYPPSPYYRLAIINCGGRTLPPKIVDLHPDEFISYFGKGKDCGAYLFAAHHVQTEWVVMMNSHVYWTKPGAVDRLLTACREGGDGLYGPWGSFEVNPHIRTACMATRTENLRAYPQFVLEPKHANDFECGNESFTSWMLKRGKPCRVVAWSGICALEDCRRPENVFRKGDQSNCILFDRHTDIFQRSGPLAQEKLQKAADGL